MENDKAFSYIEVFSDPQNGTAQNISALGCITLAKLGKDAWNNWRKMYPVRIIDNERENFPGGGYIDTSSYENRADFSGVDFRNEPIDFGGFDFGHGACFNNAQFVSDAKFTLAKFGDNTTFNYAQFGFNPDFSGAQFGDNTIFLEAKFGNSSWFNGAQFGRGAYFGGSQFGKWASFSGTQFESASFCDTCFEIDASFTGLNWESMAFLYSDKELMNAAKSRSEERGLNPKAFKAISFEGAEFAGYVDFSNRKFEERTSFGRTIYPLKFDSDGKVINQIVPENKPVIFGKAPLFHNCELHQDTTFDGAEFPPPSGDEKAVRAYRTLKLAFSKQQALHEKQLFFRLELAEETSRYTLSNRWLIYTYRLVSNYGFSLYRPILLLVATLLFFVLIYSMLAEFTPCLPLIHNDCQVRYDLLQFSIMQSIPLPGLDKWSDSIRNCLFSNSGLRNVGLIVAVICHKSISLLALFLLGLALRNRLKMK